MKLIDVTIVDYGIGNLLSVQQALEHCGATVTVSADSDEILSATHVVLPGVGAFTDGMAELCKQMVSSQAHYERVCQQLVSKQAQL